MSTPEDLQAILTALETNIRANSGFRNFYTDIREGERELEPEELDVEETLNDSAEQLKAVLAEVDHKTMTQIILALAANFGDTSTQEGEKRLANLTTYLEE